MLSSSSSAPSTTSASSLYKGKTSNRSWSQLPPEIVRLITTHYLLSVSNSAYCPATWDAREMWPSRMMCIVFRDASEVEKIMKLCPSWAAALETHLFWNRACAIIDPMDVLAQHAVVHNTTSSTPLRITPFRHFRNIIQCSCYICRINTPYMTTGLTTAKRIVHSSFLGSILVCKDHRKATYCGLCLREAPPCGEVVTSEAAMVACTENEDTDTWPNVATTCRSCRAEWLWRRMNTSVADREAVGGGPPNWSALDWETRQTVDAFVETGEGSLGEVMNISREKWWLRRFTRLGELMEQAVAASRLEMRVNGYDSDGTRATDDARSLDDAASVDVDSEDYEVLALTEDAAGVRELAVSDWARSRVLDGYWVSPADDWYGSRPGDYTAMHPAPWAVDGDEKDDVHPSPATARVPAAPTFTLADYLYRQFQRQMRVILLPAMQNVVRRAVFEEHLADPVSRLSRMEPDEVLHALQQSWPWCKTLRHDNVRVSLLVRPREREDDSSSSSKSDESHTTSPVLSTTTLQTTPSPPPSKKDDTSADMSAEDHVSASPAADDAVPLEPSNMLHPIPYVPSTLAHMPGFSQEAFRSVWREACAPVYQCRCRICERAMLNAVASGPARPPEMATAQAPVSPVETQSPPAQEIQLQEAQYQEEEEEEEEEDDDDDDDEDDDDDLLESPGFKYSQPVTPRKRSSEDLDGEEVTEEAGDDADDYETEESSTLETAREVPRDRTPPKRARTSGVFSPLTVSDVDGGRLKKRRSEERAVVMGDSDEGDRKRLRTNVLAVEEEADSPPASSELTGNTTGTDSSEPEVDEKSGLIRSHSGRQIIVGAND